MYLYCILILDSRGLGALLRANVESAPYQFLSIFAFFPIEESTKRISRGGNDGWATCSRNTKASSAVKLHSPPYHEHQQVYMTLRTPRQKVPKRKLKEEGFDSDDETPKRGSEQERGRYEKNPTDDGHTSGDDAYDFDPDAFDPETIGIPLIPENPDPLRSPNGGHLPHGRNDSARANQGKEPMLKRKPIQLVITDREELLRAGCTLDELKSCGAQKFTIPMA